MKKDDSHNDMRSAIQRNIVGEYLKMSPKEAVTEWSRVKEEASSLKGKLEDVELRKNILELLPAVAEYRVTGNRLVNGLIHEIYMAGEGVVSKIYSYNPTETMKILLTRSLDLLRNAGFVEYDESLRASITDRGKEFCEKNNRRKMYAG